MSCFGIIDAQDLWKNDPKIKPLLVNFTVEQETTGKWHILPKGKTIASLNADLKSGFDYIPYIEFSIYQNYGMKPQIYAVSYANVKFMQPVDKGVSGSDIVITDIVNGNYSEPMIASCLTNKRLVDQNGLNIGKIYTISWHAFNINNQTDAIKLKIRYNDNTPIGTFTLTQAQIKQLIEIRHLTYVLNAYVLPKTADEILADIKSEQQFINQFRGYLEDNINGVNKDVKEELKKYAELRTKDSILKTLDPNAKEGRNELTNAELLSKIKEKRAYYNDNIDSLINSNIDMWIRSITSDVRATSNHNIRKQIYVKRYEQKTGMKYKDR
jgi:hypothetical protein